MSTGTDLRSECVRLRVDERLSYTEIHKRTGVPKGTLSGWLQDHPIDPSTVVFNRASRPRTLREERFPSQSPFVAFMKPLDALTRQEKGRIAEAAVLLRLSLLGLIPSKPVFDGERSDWLVELPDTHQIRRVQVKWMKTENYGQPGAMLRSTGSSGKCTQYTPDDFDVLVGYDIHTDTCHVWNWAAIGGNKARVSASADSREAWVRLLRD